MSRVAELDIWPFRGRQREDRRLRGGGERGGRVTVAGGCVDVAGQLADDGGLRLARTLLDEGVEAVLGGQDPGLGRVVGNPRAGVGDGVEPSGGRRERSGGHGATLTANAEFANSTLPLLRHPHR